MNPTSPIHLFQDHVASISVQTDGKMRECGVTFDEGDTIKMRVDVGEKSIAFATNEGQFKEVAKVQSTKTPYYLALTPFIKGDEATLLQYSYSAKVSNPVIQIPIYFIFSVHLSIR